MSELHRDHPEATEEEIRMLAAAQLMRGGTVRPTDVVRSCRDCGAEFLVRAENANKNTKWYSLCNSCLSHHI